MKKLAFKIKFASFVFTAISCFTPELLATQKQAETKTATETGHEKKRNEKLDTATKNKIKDEIEATAREKLSEPVMDKIRTIDEKDKLIAHLSEVAKQCEKFVKTIENKNITDDEIRKLKQTISIKPGLTAKDINEPEDPDGIAEEIATYNRIAEDVKEIIASLSEREATSTDQTPDKKASKSPASRDKADSSEDETTVLRELTDTLNGKADINKNKRQLIKSSKNKDELKETLTTYQKECESIKGRLTSQNDQSGEEKTQYEKDAKGAFSPPLGKDVTKAKFEIDVPLRKKTERRIDAILIALDEAITACDTSTVKKSEKPPNTNTERHETAASPKPSDKVLSYITGEKLPAGVHTWLAGWEKCPDEPNERAKFADRLEDVVKFAREIYDSGGFDKEGKAKCKQLNEYIEENTGWSGSKPTECTVRKMLVELHPYLLSNIDKTRETTKEKETEIKNTRNMAIAYITGKNLPEGVATGLADWRLTTAKTEATEPLKLTERLENVLDYAKTPYEAGKLGEKRETYEQLHDLIAAGNWKDSTKSINKVLTKTQELRPALVEYIEKTQAAVEEDKGGKKEGSTTDPNPETVVAAAAEQLENIVATQDAKQEDATETALAIFDSVATTAEANQKLINGLLTKAHDSKNKEKLLAQQTKVGEIAELIDKAKTDYISTAEKTEAQKNKDTIETVHQDLKTACESLEVAFACARGLDQEDLCIEKVAEEPLYQAALREELVYFREKTGVLKEDTTNMIKLLPEDTLETLCAPLIDTLKLIGQISTDGIENKRLPRDAKDNYRQLTKLAQPAQAGLEAIKGWDKKNIVPFVTEQIKPAIASYNKVAETSLSPQRTRAEYRKMIKLPYFRVTRSQAYCLLRRLANKLLDAQEQVASEAANAAEQLTALEKTREDVENKALSDLEKIKSNPGKKDPKRTIANAQTKHDETLKAYERKIATAAGKVKIAEGVVEIFVELVKGITTAHEEIDTAEKTEGGGINKILDEIVGVWLEEFKTQVANLGDDGFGKRIAESLQLDFTGEDIAEATKMITKSMEKALKLVEDDTPPQDQTAGRRKENPETGKTALRGTKKEDTPSEEPAAAATEGQGKNVKTLVEKEEKKRKTTATTADAREDKPAETDEDTTG
ncbi:hypothetical protein FACS189472_04790 [Alphaproteobacteria bacterium]|nr:hypothetical protein FACS189472_04790 [Alphaproteobacteria bacterium]